MGLRVVCTGVYHGQLAAGWSVATVRKVFVSKGFKMGASAVVAVRRMACKCVHGAMLRVETSSSPRLFVPIELQNRRDNVILKGKP